MKTTILPLIAGAAIGLMGPAQARSLDAIRSAGQLGLCAHPNSLPFASKASDPPGFQVELGQALARELGVSLRLDWVITQYQMRSAGCDILLDAIADREAQGETRLRISKPYYRTGVVLAVPITSKIASFKIFMQVAPAQPLQPQGRPLPRRSARHHQRPRGIVPKAQGKEGAVGQLLENHVAHILRRDPCQQIDDGFIALG